MFFADTLKVKAVGKTYHKFCLRCTECNTTLDSTKLRDHEEQPFCVRCYNKVRLRVPFSFSGKCCLCELLQLHGPQGQGYALLGKAGG